LESPKYPAIYEESDSCASSNQSKHFWVLRVKVGLLLAVAAIAAFTWNQELGFKNAAGIIIGTVLMTSMVLTAIVDSKRFDRIWFSSRAVAESVKKESWLFMMKTKPYDGVLPEPKTEELFLDRLQQILQSQSSICSELALHSKEGTQITDQMRNARNQKIDDRLAYYLANRVRFEQQWYKNKSKWNQIREFRWFVLTWVLQLAAAALAFITIFFTGLILNPVGIITTAGAGTLSWMNARSYRELSQSYGLVAQRLSILGERKREASTEEELSEIVTDLEQAISGEHTIWLARRLVTP
jgi:hypothetical protein